MELSNYLDHRFEPTSLGDTPRIQILDINAPLISQSFTEDATVTNNLKIM